MQSSAASGAGIAKRDGQPADPLATIFCIRAGEQPAASVNRLADRVRRHLTRAVQVICLTDDPAGIGADVTCHRMPEMPLLGNERGEWHKLAVFAPEIVALASGDTALFLDCDALAVGSLDGLFDVPGECLMARSQYGLFRRANASVFRFSPRRSSDVFIQFCLNHHRIRRKSRDAAEYLARYMDSFGALGFWQRGWCADFVTDCIAPWPWRRWQPPTVPHGARVVMFRHGLTPSYASQGGTCARGRFLPAPWINEAEDGPW